MFWSVVATATVFALLLCTADSTNVLRATIGGKLPAKPVNPGFASFSVEMGSILAVIGSAGDSAVFVNLMHGLNAASGVPGASRTMRIGGNSDDESWWNPDNKPKPAGIETSVNETWFEAFKGFNAATNTTFVFGTTMRGEPDSPDMQWAVDEVAALSKYVGWSGPVVRIEVGNENDLFAENGIRPANYTFDDYLTGYGEYYTALVNAGLPKGAVQGATFCCHTEWIESVPQLLETYADTMKTLSLHRYPISHCHGHEVTLAELLAPSSSTEQAERYTPAALACQAHGVDFLIGEGNSVSCGGEYNVSDTIGAALWSMDYMFSFANISTTMVNFHGMPHGAYAAVAWEDDELEVRPLFYGMTMFTMATAKNAQLLDVSVSTGQYNVPVWATVDSDGTTRVLVLHKDMSLNEPVDVTIASADPSGWTAAATVAVLSSADGTFEATDNLTLSGLTWTGSKDGTPTGELKPTPLAPSNGVFTLTVQPATAALVTIATSR